MSKRQKALWKKFYVLEYLVNFYGSPKDDLRYEDHHLCIRKLWWQMFDDSHLFWRKEGYRCGQQEPVEDDEQESIDVRPWIRWLKLPSGEWVRYCGSCLQQT